MGASEPLLCRIVCLRSSVRGLSRLLDRRKALCACTFAGSRRGPRSPMIFLPYPSCYTPLPKFPVVEKLLHTRSRRVDSQGFDLPSPWGLAVSPLFTAAANNGGRELARDRPTQFLAKRPPKDPRLAI